MVKELVAKSLWLDIISFVSLSCRQDAIHAHGLATNQ
jgi:hypothetical protein